MLPDIFFVFSRVRPLCSQYFANGLPVALSLWASSFS